MRRLRTLFPIRTQIEEAATLSIDFPIAILQAWLYAEAVLMFYKTSTLEG
jgi:hypothetical protein